MMIMKQNEIDLERIDATKDSCDLALACLSRSNPISLSWAAQTTYLNVFQRTIYLVITDNIEANTFGKARSRLYQRKYL